MAGVKIALNDSLFATPIEPPEKIRLRGSKCNHCGVAFLGKLVACENCQSTNITEYQLPRYGKLHCYTVVRQKPPGGYCGHTDPFEPFPVGQVEMEDGVLHIDGIRNYKLNGEEKTKKISKEFKIGAPIAGRPLWIGDRTVHSE